ncbi:MAG: DUF4156 domain-containing protein [Deltaproteobacteria bacterium]|jgi:hypothetical protein|nr:DUF4156 domain-containing protein [Deltaproteobacteria bacterium]
MKPGIPRRSITLGAAFLLVCGLSWLGCKADQLSADGTKVAVLYDEPVGCENLGVVIGVGGGLSGAYSKPSVNQESAENDARNKAAERGATHVLLHPEEVDQGDGRGPDYQDTQPAMAHGSGTGSTIKVAATAYKCAQATPQTKTAMSIGSGKMIVPIATPTSISLAPLGPLKSVRVLQRSPVPSGSAMAENEVLVIEDQAQIQEVVGSLQQVVEDPMKYIPTHRVEFTGELGVQSLLYGFGYLQYAGSVYRLTDGDFERVLKLREEPAAPDVQAAPAPVDEATGQEAP